MRVFTLGSIIDGYEAWQRQPTKESDFAPDCVGKTPVLSDQQKTSYRCGAEDKRGDGAEGVDECHDDHTDLKTIFRTRTFEVIAPLE